MEKRVLLADHEPTVQSQLQAILQRLGYIVVATVSDSEQAILQARRLQPDIVIADADLPAGGAVEVAAALRETDTAPVLLVASRGDSNLVQQATAAGVLGYLLKPVSESDVLPMIEVTSARWKEWLEQRTMRDQLRDQLETRETIDQAKRWIMEQQNLTEPEAFRRIQKLAMNNRKTMKEVAQAILLTQQLA